MPLCLVYYLKINLTLLNPENKKSYEKIFSNILENLEQNIHQYVPSDEFELYKIKMVIDQKNISANMFFKYTHKITFNFDKLTKTIVKDMKNIRIHYNVFNFCL